MRSEEVVQVRAFVIAMENEADCVRPWLRPDDRLYVCGIGKVNAAAMTMKAICEGADEIWNVGVCGGFGNVEVGEVYGVESAVEYDFDLAKLNGTEIGTLDEYDTPYIGLRYPDAVSERMESSRSIKGRRTLATGDHFNDSESDYGLIVNILGASLRDMEGAAIAHVCKRFGVCCVSIKCVTNVAGKGSMTGQYKDNRTRCFEILTEAMKELLTF